MEKVFSAFLSKVGVDVLTGRESKGTAEIERAKILKAENVVEKAFWSL